MRVQKNESRILCTEWFYACATGPVKAVYQGTKEVRSNSFFRGLQGLSDLMSNAELYRE
jgi:hypothetical protein